MAFSNAAKAKARGTLPLRTSGAKPLPRAPRSVEPPLPVAFRVPRPPGVVVAFPLSTPHLFVHEGARQALQRRFVAAHRRPVVLHVTDNRHAVVSQGLRHGVLQVRVHHMFLGAPHAIQAALVRYVLTADRLASLRIGQFIEDNVALLRRRAQHDLALVPRGRHHDLLAIAAELGARHFDVPPQVSITWGRKRAKPAQPRKSLRLGSYDATERLIRIHPALDRAWVPRYFVAAVVFHELLHHVLPARSVAGRRVLHPPELLRREREFPGYARAVEWQRKNLARLLRS